VKNADESMIIFCGAETNCGVSSAIDVCIQLVDEYRG